MYQNSSPAASMPIKAAAAFRVVSVLCILIGVIYLETGTELAAPVAVFAFSVSLTCFYP